MRWYIKGVLRKAVGYSSLTIYYFEMPEKQIYDVTYNSSLNYSLVAGDVDVVIEGNQAILGSYCDLKISNGGFFVNAGYSAVPLKDGLSYSNVLLNITAFLVEKRAGF